MLEMAPLCSEKEGGKEEGRGEPLTVEEGRFPHLRLRPLFLTGVFQVQGTLKAKQFSHGFP